MYWLTFNSHKQEKAKSDNAITVCLCHPVHAVVVELTIESGFNCVLHLRLL